MLFVIIMNFLVEEKSNGESEEEEEIDQSDHEDNKISDEDSSCES